MSRERVNKRIAKDNFSFFSLFLKSKRYILFLLLTFSFIAFLYAFNKNERAKDLSDKFNEALSFIVTPFSNTFHFFSRLGDDISSYLYLREKNTQLLQENENLKNDLFKVELKLSEVDDLRDILDIKDDYQDKKSIVAQLIYINSEYGDEIAINVGKEDGVVEGAPVVNYFGFIGKVLKVYKNTSIVSMISSKKLKTPALLIKSRSSAILTTSKSGDFLEIHHLSSSSKIEEGEIAVTVADDASVPYGIKIGKVELRKGEYVVRPFYKKDLTRLLVILHTPNAR